MKEDNQQVFLTTKTALTSGVVEITGIRMGQDMIGGRRKGSNYTEYFHREGRDFHTTMESALKRCEQMRLAKIASVKKQLKNLEAMSFPAIAKAKGEA